MPPGATVIFCAHGVSPAVHANAAARAACSVIDATCPLVTKVHLGGDPATPREGYTIILIGHEGHDEVDGHDGRGARDASARRHRRPRSADVSDLGRREAARLPDADDAVGRRDRATSSRPCAQRFPHIAAPAKEDICYATQNRQAAVKALVREVDLVLVIGSRNSSNSNRLVELDELREPITSTRSTSRASAFTAAWRFEVA